MKRTLLTVLSGAIALSACGYDEKEAGSGTINVTAYGEEYIEEGIPASLLADGWSLQFDSFVVSVRDVVVGDAAMSDPDDVDLSEPSEGEGQELGSVSVKAGSYTSGSYVIDGLHVVGSATKGEETKTFDWTFDGAVQYSGCTNTTKVTDGGSATFQITVHADHFLYDSLVSEEPTASFQSFADADADGNGVITKEELSAKDIGSFDPGNDDEANDLWKWLVALSATVGHVDGEGHCSAAPEAP
jgi:hypothetical protein